MIHLGKSDVSKPFDFLEAFAMSFVIFFLPIYIGVLLLEKTVGPLVPPSRREDFAAADSLRAVPNCRCRHACNCNAGANISNEPDRL